MGFGRMLRKKKTSEHTEHTDPEQERFPPKPAPLRSPGWQTPADSPRVFTRRWKNRHGSAWRLGLVDLFGLEELHQTVILMARLAAGCFWSCAAICWAVGLPAKGEKSDPKDGERTCFLLILPMRQEYLPYACPGKEFLVGAHHATSSESRS